MPLPLADGGRNLLGHSHGLAGQLLVRQAIQSSHPALALRETAHSLASLMPGQSQSGEYHHPAASKTAQASGWHQAPGMALPQTQVHSAKPITQRPVETDDWSISEDEGNAGQALPGCGSIGSVRDAEMAQLMDMGFTPQQAMKV